MAHKELGYAVLAKLKVDLAPIADVDSEPVPDRNLLSMIVSPKKDIDKIFAKMNIVVDDTPPVESLDDELDIDETEEAGE
jgi:hypothetical protein